jgi:gas vesicle protein
MDEQQAEERRQAEPEIEERDAGGAGSFAAGIIIGAVLGAGIALLFAPERGDRTRRRLGRGLRRLREEGRERLEDASREARRELARRRRKLERLRDRVADR